MAIGIYKPGQGFWVRSMTAAFAGCLVLYTAGWAWQQMNLVQLPTASYTAFVRNAEGAVSPGQQLALFGLDLDDRRVEIGRAEVMDAQRTGDGAFDVALDNIVITRSGYDARSMTRVASPDDAFQGTVASVGETPIFEPIYLQAAVAGLILLAGAILIYWLAAINRRSCEFMIATDGEMKKVNWSTRKEVIGSTQVVIVAAFLIAGFLFLFDLGFQTFFRFIGVLET